MMDVLSQFHFIRPLWLLALPVMLLLWWLLQSLKSNHWEQYIQKELLDVLRVQQSSKSGFGAGKWWAKLRASGKWLLLFAWCTAIIAVAGPTWHKTPVPAVKNQQATVILLDLSRSMLVEDLKPNRLARAKFKLIDILKQQDDGQTALIAYAGDSYLVSPLSDDPRTIEALLPALHPSIMPSQGSNIEAAITQALELLSNAQVSSGSILLITDGVANEALSAIPKLLKRPNTLSILGVGKAEPSPIPLKEGGFLRGASGEIVLAAVNQAELQKLANSLGGRYANLNTSDADIDYLLEQRFESNDQADADSSLGADGSKNNSDTTAFDQWEDMGHWFALLLIPLVVLCFRKGVIYLLPLAFLLPPPEAQAQSYWEKLWQNKNQQAIALIEQEKYAEAAETFKRSDWAGTAHYRAGNYDTAVSELSKNKDVTSLYNLGNAQAFAGDIEAAIQTYTQVLKLAPKHADAAHNKKVLEQLQKNQQNQNKQNDQNNQQNQQDQQNQDNQQDQQSQGQNEDSNQQENSEGQQSEQDSQEGSNQDAKQSEKGQENSQQGKEPNGQEPNQGEQGDQQNESAAAKQKEDASNSDDKNEAKSAQEKKQSKLQTEDPENETDDSSYALEATPSKMKNASEQWLRSIKDNPSGLLQRKFEYQKQARSREQLNQRQLNQSKKQSSQSERY